MKAPTRESQIETYAVERAKALGGEIRKVKWIGRKNAPDRVLMLPAPREYLLQGPTIWIEFKAPGGAATFPKNAHERAQEREHNRMRKAGQCVVVIDSYAGVDEVMS